MRMVIYFRFSAFIFYFIVLCINSNCCSCLNRISRSVYYFTDEEIAKIILNVKKPKDLGDTYIDVYLKYSPGSLLDKMHLLFYYNEIRNLFSFSNEFYGKDVQDVVSQGYLMTLDNVITDKEIYNGSGEFEHDGRLYYIINDRDCKKIFLKLEKKDGDILSSVDEFSLYKDYEKIEINFNPSGISFNSSKFYEVFFKRTNKILTVELRKVSVQNTNFFTIKAMIYYNGKFIKESRVKNDEACGFSIDL